jgi:hypothetical protein
MNGMARYKDLSVVVLLGLLCWLVHEQVQLAPPSWFPGDIGVAAVPGLVNSVLAFLLLLLAAQTAMRWKKTKHSAGVNADRLQWSKLAGVAVLYFLFIAAVALSELHFSLLATAFLASSLWLLLGGGWRHAAISLAFGVVVSGLCQLLFVSLFGVVLP